MTQHDANSPDLPVPGHALAASDNDFMRAIEAFSGVVELRRMTDPARPLIAARNDAEAVATWLKRFSSPKTLRMMRKEAERFLLWVIFERQTTFSELTVEDVQAFKVFLANPSPEDRWVSPTKWPLGHPAWRPFAGKLSGYSQQYAFNAVGALFRWLQKSGYIRGNPVGLETKPELTDDEIRDGRDEKDSRRRVMKRLLPPEGIQFALRAADMGSPLKAARDRFLITFYYLTGVRTFEGTGSNMKDVKVSENGRRWLPVLGKRRKYREVPISPELYESLKAYRVSFGLPAEISPDEGTPLILASNSKLKRASDSTVLKAISSVMERASSLAEEEGLPDLAKRMRDARTHWLRHSCFSHLLKATGDLALVKELAGHDDIRTTSIYLHTDDDHKHDEISSALSVLPR